jgi:hypothetical protein
MGVFLVTFDLKDATESSYERIYEWAHRIGGYRYLRFADGKWGRLPSTTVVVPLEASNNVAARDAFQPLLEKANYNGPTSPSSTATAGPSSRPRSRAGRSRITRSNVLRSVSDAGRFLSPRCPATGI